MSETQEQELVFDGIIIGGGMVGATVACGLAQAGFRVAVVEPKPVKDFVPSQAPDLRVSAVSYASEQVLKNVGAWQHVEAMRSCPYRRLAVNEIHEQTGFASLLPDISAWARTEFVSTQIGQDHLGHIVENTIIQSALHKRLLEQSSAEIFCPSQAKSIDLGGDTKSVYLDTGELLQAPLVIGADGANSQVRKSADIGQYKEQYEQHAFVISVSYEGDQEDITWQAFRRNGPLAFLPMMKVEGTQYASLVWYDSSEKISQLVSLDEESLIGEIREHFPPECPEISSVHGKGRFPLFKSHAHSYTKQGVVLAGDAAHTINPLAGQGVNLGFMDAASLVEILVNAHLNGLDFSSSEVLAQYEKRRRSANQLMMSAMDAFYYGFGSKHLPMRVVRNLGLGIAQRADLAKKQVIKYAMGISGDLPRLARPI